ncbi:MAG: hypothetical protein WCP68_19210, partial [Enhydrobacter sp.]
MADQPLSFRRTLSANIVALAPAYAALAALYGWGALAGRPALIAGAGVTVVTVLLVQRYLGSLARFARFVSELSDVQEPVMPRLSFAPATEELASAAATLAMGWRRQRASERHPGRGHRVVRCFGLGRREPDARRHGVSVALPERVSAGVGGAQRERLAQRVFRSFAVSNRECGELWLGSGFRHAREQPDRAVVSVCGGLGVALSLGFGIPDCLCERVVLVPGKSHYHEHACRDCYRIGQSRGLRFRPCVCCRNREHRAHAIVDAHGVEQRHGVRVCHGARHWRVHRERKRECVLRRERARDGVRPR